MCDNLSSAPVTVYSRCQTRSPCPHPLFSHSLTPPTTTHWNHKKSLSSISNILKFHVSQQHNRPIFSGKWKCKFSSLEPSRFPAMQIQLHVNIIPQACPDPLQHSVSIPQIAVTTNSWSANGTLQKRLALQSEHPEELCGPLLGLFLKGRASSSAWGRINIEEALGFTNVDQPSLEQESAEKTHYAEDGDPTKAGKRRTVDWQRSQDCQGRNISYLLSNCPQIRKRNKIRLFKNLAKNSKRKCLDTPSHWCTHGLLHNACVCAHTFMLQAYTWALTFYPHMHTLTYMWKHTWTFILSVCTHVYKLYAHMYLHKYIVNIHIQIHAYTYRTYIKVCADIHVTYLPTYEQCYSYIHECIHMQDT